MSNEEFNAIIREKQKYKRMKVNVKNVSEKQENMTLNSVNSRKITELYIIYVAGDFNWLKFFVTVNLTKSKHLHLQNVFLCVFING